MDVPGMPDVGADPARRSPFHNSNQSKE